jgi:beta-1,4-mannosyltransferase
VRMKRLLFALLLARAALLRTPTIWTVHNVSPHERGPRVERRLLDTWSRLATRRVYMYESALPDPPEARDVCIPRGDYEPIYGALREAVTESSRPLSVLLFGLLRPYKGIEHLIDVVRQCGDEGVELLVTGSVLDEAYGSTLLRYAEDIENVTIHIEYLSNEQLAQVILQNTLVVLPYLNMYNSGAALLSLTLHRPILVPATPTMRQLQHEVGESWVQLYDGELTPDDLRTALKAAGEAPMVGPNLNRRDWHMVGRRYADLYREVALGRGRRGRGIAQPAHPQIGPDAQRADGCR